MEGIIKELSKEFERRTILESYERIKICLARLSEQQVWNCPNDNLVSIGNLIMHLNGNVKQWILSGLGGEADDRDRDFEFANRKPIPIDKLLNDLHNTLQRSVKCIQNLSVDDLLIKRKVQCYEETTLSIIIHVIEHFSYHMGQITYYTKYIKNVDTGYYADDPLSELSN